MKTRVNMRDEENRGYWLTRKNKKFTKTKKGRFDLHPTPAKFTQVLLDNISLPTTLWECACGKGHMSEVLKAAGHKVISTDLVDWGYGAPGVDFLTQKRPRATHIVTNPPFNLAVDFITHGLDWLDSGDISLMAVIMALEKLSGKRRYLELYNRRMPEMVLCVADSMPNIHLPGYTYPFHHAWYVWTAKRPRYSKLYVVSTRW